MSLTVLRGDLPLDLVRALRSSGRVAVDTETSGLDWSMDSLQLCQLYSDEVGVVLLREVSDSPSNFVALMSDPAVTKVFHFAPFDLRFLEAQWGVRVRAVQCTKAASRLLEPDLPPPAHTLQALLDRHMSISIDKGAVRTSDWGAASLSSAQLEYAAADVAHLTTLADVLMKKLAELEMVSVFEQVCAYMPLDAHLDVTGVPNPLFY